MTHIDMEKLKCKIDVLALLKHYEFDKIDDKGEWVWALCPYHDDKNPSFAIRKGNTKFHCFSCKVKGDAVQLVMDLENVDFQTAVTRLSALSGYIVSEDSKIEYLKETWLNPEATNGPTANTLLVSQRLFDLNSHARRFFIEAYKGSPAETYLQGRHFNEDSVTKFGLGYYPENFIPKMVAAGYTEAELEAAGFITPQGYERFLNRLMFPIYDADGRNIAFSGRALLEGQEPKYTATPNSDYYKKGNVLFGLQRIVNQIPVILVEGNLDCVRLHEVGINALAQLGTALTAEQVKLLKHLTDNVILLYDGDEAGLKTSFSSILPLIEEGILVKVAMLPSGQDPDTYVQLRNGESLRYLLEDAFGGLEYYAHCRESAGKQSYQLLSEVLWSINRIPDEKIKEHYIQTASKVFGFSEKSIKAELKRTHA